MQNFVLKPNLLPWIIDYQKLFSSNGTAHDKQQNVTEQYEKSITLYLDMYKNISSEHIFFKNMLENTFKELKECISKYHDRLKQKDNGEWNHLSGSYSLINNLGFSNFLQPFHWVQNLEQVLKLKKKQHGNMLAIYEFFYKKHFLSFLTEFLYVLFNHDFYQTNFLLSH